MDKDIVEKNFKCGNFIIIFLVRVFMKVYEKKKKKYMKKMVKKYECFNNNLIKIILNFIFFYFLSFGIIFLLVIIVCIN